MSTEQSTHNPQISAVTPDTLLTAPRRWYLAAQLKVAEGFDERFQPTGFPNLGPALYKAMNNGGATDYLLVESAQSLANWMEAICLDPQNPCRYNADCAGIPYALVREKVNQKDKDLTSSLTEPHRLASDMVLDAKNNSQTFSKLLTDLLQVDKQRPVYLPRIAKRLFYIDPACLLHGVFLKLDGRIRFPRLLSATITAKQPEPVNAGGVMRGYVTAAGSEASIPYSTQHFASSDIQLQLTFHTDTLKSWGLDNEEQQFLASFALYKLNKLLNSFPRLRTACVLDPDSVPGVNADLSTAIEAAFTEDRRKKMLDDAKDLPKPFKDGEKMKGFNPFELDRS